MATWMGFKRISWIVGSFMIFATILVAIGYPVVGSWHWGGGWLGGLEGGFYDFEVNGAVRVSFDE